MGPWLLPIFYANVAAHGALVVGAVWSVAMPTRRLYPMEDKSAGYYVMWFLFYFVFASNFAIALLDWNSAHWTGPARFVLATPLVALGGAFVTWGIATLGTAKTSGRAIDTDLVTAGPYGLSRNPQYVGDIVLFAGITILANSELALVSHALTSLVFLIAPLAEEPWLRARFGGAYDTYRKLTPRFL